MTSAVVPQQLSSEDVAHLRGLTAEWVRFSLRREWDALCGLLTDDVTFLPPDQPVVVGKSAVRTWFDSFPAIRAFTATLEAAEGRPDLAWARGSFTMTVEPQPQQTVSIVGKWAATYRKRGDGDWLCASDTWNVDAPMGA